MRKVIRQPCLKNDSVRFDAVAGDRKVISMSFRANLIHLRAANNMTQEQLAMLLGVSRQSVTKWESEKSYPEMDKLLKMCQIFDCTLDDLVQGDLSSKSASPTAMMYPVGHPADVFGYDELMNRFANKISLGCVAPVAGCALGTVFFALSSDPDGGLGLLPEGVAAAFGLLCIFIGVAICLALVIPAAFEHESFVKAHPYLEDFYTPEQKAQARAIFTPELVGGILGICFGICLLLVFSDTPYEMVLGIPSMLLLIAVGVRFIIHGALTLGKTNIEEYNKAAGEVLTAQEIESLDMGPEQKQELLIAQKQEKRIGAVCGIIMIVATIVGLVMLFVPEYRNDYFWLSWAIGGLLCGVATLLIKGFAKPVE